MREVHKSRAASIDLDNIWYYIAADNPDAADAFFTDCLHGVNRMPISRALGNLALNLGVRFVVSP
jgi:plasmid stabilization system protein ParE